MGLLVYYRRISLARCDGCVTRTVRWVGIAIGVALVARAAWLGFAWSMSTKPVSRSLRDLGGPSSGSIPARHALCISRVEMTDLSAYWLIGFVVIVAVLGLAQYWRSRRP